MMMVKPESTAPHRLSAGALYMAIVVCLMMGMISSAIILVAAHYRNGYQKVWRYQRLLNNLNSAIHLSLGNDLALDQTQLLDLFGNGQDSVCIQKRAWGAFELGLVSSFRSKDTLRRAFLLGSKPDSVALYVSDEDRPLSISGSARIIGNASLPKSGIRKSYADGKPYTGENLVYQGRISNSDRFLPALDGDFLNLIKAGFTVAAEQLPIFRNFDLTVSHFEKTRTYRVDAPYQLEGHVVNGNVVLWSDSLIEVGPSMRLDGAILIAPTIRLLQGFQGSIQAFASDSIVVGKRVNLSFPSLLAVLRQTGSPAQPKLVFGEGSHCAGWLICQEDSRSQLETIMELAKDVELEGTLYCNGILKLEKGTNIKGKTACNRLLMRTPATLYENFLIDVRLSTRDRHVNFLDAALLSGKGRRKEVLRWLN